ncbi:MAG: hypothetical protein IT197_02430 [Acidimicrobiia bacterium]|nr:hypothetical protein [Acidimicrobiia bacterium]
MQSMVEVREEALRTIAELAYAAQAPPRRGRPAPSTGAERSVATRVRCTSIDQQIASHSGYELTATDHADLALLRGLRAR